MLSTMFTRGLFFLLAATLAAIAVLFSSNKSTPERHSQPRKWPGRNNTVLFLSNVEHGLANVLLATSHAMILDQKDLEVHYASFKKLEKDISTISKFASQTSSNVKPITFHTLTGTTYGDALLLQGHGVVAAAINKPGIGGAAKLCRNMQKYLMPWSGPEYLAIYEEISRLLEEVDPIVVAVDPLFGPGMDAIRAQGRNHAIVSPNSLKDNFGSLQPWGSMFWKYPAISSGYAYPVPWHLIPANIYMNLRFIYSVVWTPQLSEKKAYLKRNGILKPLDVFSVYQKDLLWLSQSSPQADFPISVIPENVVACGPIFLSSAPASEQDPELASWLERAPTVLINLGSSVNYDEVSATEMARGIKILLANSRSQVLWKFNKRSDFSDEFLSDLSDEIASGRVRLAKWLKADPAALLETGNIALLVHHGGANCYHEAVGTGVPQVVLPMWVDLYDFAARVEYLGIGVWGNPKSAPNWTAEELGTAFLKVLGDSDAATSMRKRAQELGNIYQRKPGRITAAREIAKLAHSEGS